MPPIDDDEFERTTFVPFAGVRATSTPDVIGHYLVSVEGSEPGRRIEIASDPTTFGRDAKQARIVFADTQVSRLHARASLAGGDVIVENLSATNGTYVDGTRIDASTALRDGSVVRMGSQTLRYERRSRQDVERAQELDRDLLKARNYVLSLLPPPSHRVRSAPSGRSSRRRSLVEMRSATTGSIPTRSFCTWSTSRATESARRCTR